MDDPWASGGDPWGLRGEIRDNLVAPVATFARQVLQGAIRCPMSSLESAAGDGSTFHRLRETQRLIEEPLDPKRVARAYDLVRQAAEATGQPRFAIEARSRDSSKELKQVARAVRDLLVICCCLGKGCLTAARFEGAMERAFDRPLEPELIAQLSMALMEILALGLDRAHFDERAPRVFGGPLPDDVTTGLWLAYSECDSTLRCEV